MTDEARCPSCRRTVRVVSGAVGPECARCHGLLLGASLSKPKDTPTSPPAATEPMAPAMREAMLDTLEDFAPRVSAEQLAELQRIGAEWVEHADRADEQALEDRRQARTWREALPDVAEAMGVGR